MNVGDTAGARILIDSVLARCGPDRFAVSVDWFTEARLPNALQSVSVAAFGGNAAREAQAALSATPTHPASQSTDRLLEVYTSARSGDINSAIAQLRLLLDRPSLVTRKGLSVSPRWDFLRHDPRFQSLLSEREPTASGGSMP